MDRSDAGGEPRQAFDRRLGELRPKLHRYCARMTGSVFDGEDVLQDALGRAVQVFDPAAPPANLEAWLFRIAHNTAIDFLRRRSRQAKLFSHEDADVIPDPAPNAEDRHAAASNMRAFLALPVLQRSSVILMDLLGYSLDEIGDLLEATIPAVKAALHRGRARLRSTAAVETPRPTRLDTAQRALLARYVDHFNARDFDAIRTMIADDVRLELVNKTRLNGKAEVSRYFGNYDKARDWHLVPGLVEGRPAILVFDPNEPGAGPKYFMLVDWQAGKIATIRDFRHATYVVDGLEYRT